MVDGFVSAFGSSGGGGGGSQGTQGVQGVQGTQGLQGDLGNFATQGIQGIQGVQGEIGVQGIQGVQGTQGVQGIQGGGGIIAYYGGFFSNDDQPLVSTTAEQVITLNGTYESNQVTIQNTSEITFANAGTYQLTFVVQLFNNSNDSEFAKFWIKYNGVNWDASTTEAFISKRKSAGVPSSQIVTIVFVGTALNPNDYVELYWSGTSTDLLLQYEPAETTPILIPETPSVIVSVIPVAYSIQGVQGLQGIQGTQGVQGIQGIPSDVVGAFGNASSSAFQTAGTINTYQPVTFSSISTGTEFPFTLTGGNTIRCAGLDGVTTYWNFSAILCVYNSAATTETITIEPYINGVASGFKQSISVGADATEQITTEVILATGATQSFTLEWQVSDLAVQLVAFPDPFATTQSASVNMVRMAGTIQGAQGIQGRQGTQGLGAIVRYATFGQSSFTLTAPNVYEYLPLNLVVQATTFGDWSISSTTQLFGFYISANTPPYIVSGNALIENTDSVTHTAFLIINNGGTDVTYSEVSIEIPANSYVVLPIEAIINIDGGNPYIQIGFKSDSTLVNINNASSSYGFIANTYVLGSTLQGLQGFFGFQGTQGLQGFTSSQGVQGIIGIQGLQGVQGEIGLQGIQGVQGTQGTQGVQGLQGVQGTNAGVNAPSISVYYNTNQTASVSITEQQLLLNSTFSTTGDITLSSNTLIIPSRDIYRITLLMMLENTTGTQQKSWAWIRVNGVDQTGTTNLVSVEAGEIVQQLVEIIRDFQPSDIIDFSWEVTDVGLISKYVTSASNYPTGGANKVDVYQLSKVLDPKNSSAKLSWTTGYVNLTNGVDNQLPMNLFTEDGNALTSSNLSTSNSAIQILETGVYQIDTFSHLFDMGTDMTLSHTLYTSLDGTTWTFLTISALQRYGGSNTNQVQIGTYRLVVTSLPLYIQMRLQPSANSPFPADISSPTNLMVTKIGNI